MLKYLDVVFPNSSLAAEFVVKYICAWSNCMEEGIWWMRSDSSACQEPQNVPAGLGVQQG